MGPQMSREEGRVQYVPEGSTIPHRFDTLEYMAAQPERTAWLSRRMRRALEYIEILHKQMRETKKLPERTLRSYVLQEAEAVSRRAKIHWAREHLGGDSIINLQHDGVVVRRTPHL